MLVVSHKMVFYRKQSCVTMRNYAGTITVTFDITFAFTKFIFGGALFKRILAWERGISKS